MPPRLIQELLGDRRQPAPPGSVGVLAPGDRPPLPGVVDDFYDYRGIATAREIEELDARRFGADSFRLGWLLDPKSNQHEVPVALPLDVLRRHAAVIGPSGTGKTTGILVPWIVSALRGGSSVVALDVKGDLLETVLGYAKRDGEMGVPVGKWDYTALSQSVVWPWLQEATTPEQVDAIVEAILGREDKQSSADPFFYRRDWQLMRGVLQLLSTQIFPGRARPSHLGEVVIDQGLLTGTALANPRAPGASDILATVAGLDAVDYKKAAAGVATALAELNSPAVDQVSTPSSTHPTLDMDLLLGSPHLLVVAAPLHGGKKAKFLSTIFLNLFVRRLYARLANPGRHVFLVIDEAPRIVDRFDFEEVLSVSRSAGVSVVLAAQDVGQFRDENERAGILANCATCISIAGAHSTSAKFFMERLGKHRVQVIDVGRTEGGTPLGTFNRSERIELQDVLAEREIKYPPFGRRCAIAHINAGELAITSKPLLLDLSIT
jgi:type IV secretory pathway TraG/TraD family ATPase VirD4